MGMVGPMEEVFRHFREDERIDSWLVQLGNSEHGQEILPQLCRIFSSGHELGLDWYITRDGKTIRCGRRNAGRQRAQDRLVRIIPNGHGADVVWKADPDWADESRRRVSLPLQENVFENLNECLENLSRHHAHKNGMSRDGYWPDDYGAEDIWSEFEALVQQARGKTSHQRAADIANAEVYPARKEIKTFVFLRNPDIVVEILTRADGRCEGCGQEAPFKRRSDGEPYLEVHHKFPLASGGPDTIENSIALCPNCHRNQHFGASPPHIE